MITGAIAQEDKDRCLSFVIAKYDWKDVKEIHVTPLKARVRVEVTTKTGVHKHYLKKKPCGNYEELELPGNDR